MKKKIIAGLMAALVFSVSGCSGAVTSDASNVSDPTSTQSAEYNGYKTGTVENQTYTNKDYGFSVTLPDNYTLYDYEKFGERIKKRNNLTDEEYTKQVVNYERDFVYLFSAYDETSGVENSGTIFEITLQSYTSCQTNNLEQYANKTAETYSGLGTDTVKYTVAPAVAVTFGNNAAYRIDYRSESEENKQNVTQILFCADSYFVSVAIYSSTDNDETFKQKRDLILESVKEC